MGNQRLRAKKAERRARLAARQGGAALSWIERVFAQEKVFEAAADLYFGALANHRDTAHLDLLSLSAGGAGD